MIFRLQFLLTFLRLLLKYPIPALLQKRFYQEANAGALRVHGQLKVEKRG
jgi:hypothetical protein